MNTIFYLLMPFFSMIAPLKVVSQSISSELKSNVLFDSSTKVQTFPFKFKKTIHDYGVIIEGNNPTCFFEFKNIGKDTIEFGNNYTTRGTGLFALSWDRRTILPGDSGRLSISYPSSGRIGNFNKSAFVFEKNNFAVKFSVRGIVILPETLKAYAGNIQAIFYADSSVYNIGKVVEGEEAIIKIPFRNLGKDTLHFYNYEVFYKGKNFLKIVSKKGEEIRYVLPKKSGILELHYTPASYYGYDEVVLTLFTNDRRILIPIKFIMNVIKKKSINE